MVSKDELRKGVEEQIQTTVYELVTWTSGSFDFALNDVAPTDEIAMAPGELLPSVSLDTQMILMEAMRIFDERNRSGAAPEPAPRPDARRSRPVAELVEDPIACVEEVVPEPVEVREEATPRLQVVSADRSLAAALSRLLGDQARVARVGLRDAGSPPPGEEPPVVLVDLRSPSLSVDHVARIKRRRSRAPVVVVAGPDLAVGDAYAAGALTILPPNVAAIAACFTSVARHHQGLSSERAIALGVRSGFEKLHRVLRNLRSGLVSATMSLTLMHVLSETVERAVLFLARQHDLMALGAFGLDGEAGTQGPVRGLSIPNTHGGALMTSLQESRALTLPFEGSDLPTALRQLVGPPRNGECAIFPVVGGEQTIAVVYADNGRSQRGIEEIELLELATAQVGMAFENELLRRRVMRANQRG